MPFFALEFVNIAEILNNISAAWLTEILSQRLKMGISPLWYQQPTKE
jgi:hypothetical protein